MTRRELLMGAAVAGAARGAGAERLFDGRSLEGWIQFENSSILLSAAGVRDPDVFLRRVTAGEDAVSVYLRGRVKDASTVAAAVRGVNEVLAGESIYEAARFRGVSLRGETEALLKKNPSGVELARLNKMLLEDAYASELLRSVTTGWVARDGAMASTGVGRGVIYTAKDYGRFKLTFTMRHVSGNPDHQACVLIFCTRPKAGEKPLDALGGIQFQVPNAGHWDYRPGMNNAGGAEFTTIQKPKFDPHEWSRVEIVADASKGWAKMRVAQPVGSEMIEALEFRDPAAGKAGPIAWQMHNAGLVDEYRDVEVETV